MHPSLNVDDDQRAGGERVGDAARGRRRTGDVDEPVGRIGRRLDIDRADLAAGFRGLRRGLLRCFPEAGLAGFRHEAHAVDPVLGHQGMDQEFGAAIDRLRKHESVARPEKRHQRGRDRSHTGCKRQRLLRAIPDGESILQDFKIGVVDARVDEMRFLIARLFPQPIGEFERRLALLRCAEDERRRLEQRRLQRAFGKMRRIAVPHHQRLWRKLACPELP